MQYILKWVVMAFVSDIKQKGYLIQHWDMNIIGKKDVVYARSLLCGIKLLALAVIID